MKTFKSDTDNCVYNSSGDSIEELISKADACIIGTVTDEYDLSDFSVIQIINVDQTIKGNNIDSQINLLRMKGHQLEEDITYTLLIAERGLSETDDIYYVLGGYESLIFKEENGTLTAMNNRIDQDLKEVLQQNNINTFNLDTKEISDTEKLINYIQGLN
ncbi:hypothetical protein SH1V18_38170 [Vallitalea longa]|uniref:Uncharacterized protein n=1 Tax=Vallitalea longa TaxID=2936439 RepID=A0A9W6DH95_9FIRM|nr:hypothetical protein [Vallitalea longa]GKX31337.1 hypothetical protein SH1V18_38170 [Vallitalea longa]